MFSQEEGLIDFINRQEEHLDISVCAHTALLLYGHMLL